MERKSVDKSREYPAFHIGDVVLITEGGDKHVSSHGKIARVICDTDGKFIYMVRKKDLVMERRVEKDLSHVDQVMKTVDFRINGFIDELRMICAQEEPDLPPENVSLNDLMEGFMGFKKHSEQFRAAFQQLCFLMDLRNEVLGL